MFLILVFLLTTLAFFIPFAIASTIGICIMQNKTAGAIKNRAAAPGNPALDPPLSRPLVFVPRVLDNLTRSAQWLLRWPSTTELLMICQVVLLLLPPLPQLLNNVLEEVLSWVYGKYGDPDGAWPDPFRDPVGFCRFIPVLFKRIGWSVGLLLRWFSFVSDPQTKMVNLNHALINYFSGLNYSLPVGFDVETLAAGDWVTKQKTQVMAICSRIAYERWHVARSIVAKEWPGFEFVCAWHFDQISLIPNPGDKREVSYVKTSAFLLSTRGGAFVLAFRGTEPLENVGWLTDFDVVPPSAGDSDWPYGKYHSGFRRALGLDHALRGDPSVQCGYLEQEGPHLVRKAAESRSPYDIISARIAAAAGGNGRLYVTGHSLGGALANLYVAAALSPSPGAGILGGTEIGLYTFGQPRVGNNQYARHLARALNRQKPAQDSPRGRLLRYARGVNTNDVVPRVPPPLDNFYQHSGQLIFLEPSPTNPHPNPNSQSNSTPPVVFLEEQPSIFRIWAVMQGTKKAQYALEDYVKNMPRSSLVTVVLAWLSVYTTILPVLLVAPVLVLVDPVSVAVLLALGVFLLGLPVGILDHSLGGYEAAIESSAIDDWNGLDQASQGQ